jgi:hypothetical protein
MANETDSKVGIERSLVALAQREDVCTIEDETRVLTMLSRPAISAGNCTFGRACRGSVRDHALWLNLCKKSRVVVVYLTAAVCNAAWKDESGPFVGKITMPVNGNPACLPLRQ